MDFKKMIQGMKDKEAEEENKKADPKEEMPKEEAPNFVKEKEVELEATKPDTAKIGENLPVGFGNRNEPTEKKEVKPNMGNFQKVVEVAKEETPNQEPKANEGLEISAKLDEQTNLGGKPVAPKPQEAPKEQPKEAPKLQEQPQEKPTVEASFSAKMNKPIQKSKWGLNEYETEDGEEWFIGTEEEAYEAAKEDIRNFVDDVGYGGFTDNFKDWIYANAVDSDFLADLRSEEADYLRGEGENEQAEWIENMDDSETISYLEDIYGGDIGKFLEENNAIDFDKVAEEAISWDGIAHFLASYDGDEVELPNGLYAYRRN